MSWNTKVRKFPMCAKSYTVGPQEYIRTSPAVCGTNASFFPLKVLWRTISVIESTPALLESKTNSRFYLSLANPPIERSGRQCSKVVLPMIEFAPLEEVPMPTAEEFREQLFEVF